MIRRGSLARRPPPDRDGLVLGNATWLSFDAELVSGTIVIAQGRIARLAVGTDAAAVGNGLPVLDAGGHLVLPGLIDPHVHLREPGQRYKEGIANGSRAALKGGVTTVLDMPNNRPPTTTPRRLAAKRERFARKCRVNWGLHVQAAWPPVAGATAGAASLKLYMARSSTRTAINEPARVARLVASAHRLTVHAEDETLFLDGLGPGRHHDARPAAAVQAGLAKVEEALRGLPRARRPRVVVCHVSTVAELAWLRRLKGEGFDVWGEACPHYLLLTAEDYRLEGPRLQVNPPLRSAADRDAVLAALADSTLDFVATDHAPHAPAEKASATPPSGLPGLEWLGPLLYTLVARGALSWRRFQEVGCAAAARCYGIPNRDGLREGNAADLVLMAPGPPPHSAPVTRAGYNPYAGVALAGHVAATLVNGRVGYYLEQFPDSPAGVEVTR